MGAKLIEEHKDVRLVEELLGHRPGSKATMRYIELKSIWAAQSVDRITDAARPRGHYLHARRARQSAVRS
jgi:site-specific recombinase XerC